jgi:Flp pilus assembly protein TadD
MLVAAAVAALVYAPSLAGGFLYDDGAVIVRNPYIRDLGALGTILRYEPARPLLGLCWALNFAVAGLEPWPYHLVNVLVHAVNAALLVPLFRWMGARAGRSAVSPAALLGACLFAATPMAAETVAYIASRSSALMASFALASLWLVTRAWDTGSRRHAAAAFACFLAALATKEEAAALPLVLLLVDYFFLSQRRLEALRPRAWLHGCFLAVLPLGLVARRMATGTWLPAPAIDTGQYLLTQWTVFPLYLFRAVLPFDPAFYRYHLPAPWPPDATTLAFGLLTAALLLIAFLRQRFWPDGAFAVLCLAAGLLPSSSIVALNEMVVDHRAYFGGLGVAFALGGVLWKHGGLRWSALVLLVFAARSVQYQWVLADDVRAWEHAVSRSPHSGDAWCALGESYAARRDPRAEAAFLQATRLGPALWRYWSNLGVYYNRTGRPAEAVPAMERAVQAAPRDGVLRDYLGQVLLATGREADAEAAFAAAIAAEPALVLPRIHLAALLLRRGQPERARSELDAAQRLPTEPQEAAAILRLQRQLP